MPNYVDDEFKATCKTITKINDTIYEPKKQRDDLIDAELIRLQITYSQFDIRYRESQ